MGKVYEANTLLAYAKDRVQAYKAFGEQLEALKKALHAVATLDNEFQGKGADNIKGFYKTQVDIVTHWKSLVSSHQAYFNSIADYAEQAKLKGDTIVDVSFLEQELAVANDRSKQMVEQQHAELESILSNIEDIIHITPFSTGAFEDDIRAAEKKRTDTITAVEELDNQLSSEYGMLDNFYESVQFSVNGLEQLTSQGGSAYQLTFDAKVYKNSEEYKTQQQIDKVASGYVEGKVEQKQDIKERKVAIEAERQRQIQANKPWYEKGLDLAGEFSGYYDFKRAAEGVDPVTGEKLSTSQRVAAGAMAAAGFIPVVGWVGRAAKGGKAIYKTAKGLSAADHALDAYKSAKSFKVLQQTEKGLYGLVTANGLGEYMTGRDMFGNKISEEQRKSSLLQALGIAGAGALSTKVAGKTAKAGATMVANGTKKLREMRNVLSKQATQRIMPPLQSAQKVYRSSAGYMKKKISQARDIKLAPKKVRVVEEPMTRMRMPVVDEWITGKDVGRMFSVRNADNSTLTRGNSSPSSTTTSGSTITTVRYGDHMKRGALRQKELEPNVRYVTQEGYKYTTDAAGRIVSVEAPQLILKKGKRKLWMQRIAGRKDRLPDDDGGHLIATQFHGSGDIDNLVAQNSQINRSGGEWFKMEQQWAKALSEIPPKKVSLQIVPLYEGDSLRPVKFNILYKIEGKRRVERTILNKEGG